MPTATVITMEQYRALQRPIVLPTPDELLDFEIETLVGKGLARYEQADPFRKDPPSGLFLLIPPKPDPLDLVHLMNLVVNGKTGANYLDPAGLSDVIEVPGGPYLLTNIEDGDGRRNVKPSVSAANIASEGRSPYTTWEGLVHVIVFPDVLSHHNLDLVGSRYGSEVVQFLGHSDGGPGLLAHWHVYALSRWGAPSCGSRLVA